MLSDLECGICYRLYNAGWRRPRQLSCKHSFCENCLVTLAQSAAYPTEDSETGSRIVCAFCRHPTTLTEARLRENFPVDEEILERLLTAGALEEKSCDDEDDEEQKTETSSRYEGDGLPRSRKGRLWRSMKRLYTKGQNRERRGFAEPPSVATTVICIKEVNNPSGDLNNLDNTCTVHPTSQKHFVPIISDINNSKNAAAKTLSTKDNTVSVWNEKPFSGEITSPVFSTSPNRVELNSVDSHAESSMMHLIRTNESNFVHVGGNYKLSTLSPNNSSNLMDTSPLNQDQYEGHVHSRIPLPSSHADGPQHGGKRADLSKSDTQLSERTSIRKYIGQGLKASKDIPSNKLNPMTNLKSFLQLPVHREQTSFIQKPLKSYVHIQSKGQALREDQSVSSWHTWGGQKSIKMNTALQREHQMNKTAIFIKVSSNYLPKGLHRYESAKTSTYTKGASGQDQIKDMLWTTQYNPFTTTNKGIESSQNKPSMDTKGKRIYISPAFQPSLNYLNASNSDPHKAKFVGSHPGSLSLSSYLEQQNLRKLDPQANGAPQASTQRTVQWISIMPYPASSKAHSFSSHYGFSASSQSGSRNHSTHRSQNQPDSAKSKNAHSVWGFKSPLMNIMVNGIKNSNGEVGSTHSDPLSKDPHIQVVPDFASQNSLTSDSNSHQTSKFVYLKNSDETWEGQTSSEPPSATSEIWPASMSLEEDPYGKRMHDYNSHTQNNTSIPDDSNMNNSEDLGQSSTNFYPTSIQASYDLPALEYGKPNTKLNMDFSELQPGQGLSETSNGWIESEFVSPEITKVPSTNNPVKSISEHDQSIINNYFAINSSQISQTVAIDSEKPFRQDLRVASDVSINDGKKHIFNGSTLMWTKPTSIPNLDAEQTLDQSRNYSQSEFIQNHQNSLKYNFITSDEAAHHGKLTQSSPSLSPASENQLIIDGANLSGNNFYSNGESTTRTLTFSHIFGLQKGNKNQDGIPSSEFDLANLKASMSQDGTEPLQTEMATVQSVPKEVQLILLENNGQIKTTRRNQIQNNELADTIQLHGSQDNASQNSRPTNVRVAQHIKVYPQDNVLKSGSGNGQTATYRSPIIRINKSKTKISVNETINFSKDNVYENNLKLNQSTGMYTQTSQTSLKVEEDLIHDGLSAASQSGSRNHSAHRSQNQPDFANSKNAHSVWGFEPLLLNIMANRIQIGNREVGSTHSNPPSKVPILQVVPDFTSQSSQTPDGYHYQTSKFVHRENVEESREGQPSGEPPSVNSGIWPANMSFDEDAYGKRIHDYNSHTQNNPSMPDGSNVNNSEDLGQSSINFYPTHIQASYDLQGTEYGKPSTKLNMDFSELQPGQGQSETSNGWIESEFVSPEITKVPSTNNPVISNEHDQSIINNYLAINSRQISKTVAIASAKPYRQDLSVASDVPINVGNKHINGSILMWTKPTSIPNLDAEETLDQSRNYSQSEYIQNQNSSKYNFTASDEAAHHGKLTQTSPSLSPASENPLNIDGAYFSGNNIYGESTTHNRTFSHIFRLQKGNKKHSITYSAIDLASPKAGMSQDGTGHFQTEMATMQSVPKEVQFISLENKGQDNTSQNSRPTSSVVVGKRIKIHPQDMTSGSGNGQTTTYRSPIVRISKSKTKISVNESMDPSKDNTTYESKLKLNQSTEMHSQTPSKVEVDPSYVNFPLNFSGTNISVNSKPNEDVGSLNSLKSSRQLNQTNFKAIQSSDILGSAIFSLHSG